MRLDDFNVSSIKTAIMMVVCLNRKHNLKIKSKTVNQ